MNKTFQLDLKRVPDELILIFDILKNSKNECEITKEQIKNTDWEKFLKLVIHHRVYPLILNSTNPENNLIPSHVVQTISQINKRNTFQMLYLCSEMEQVNNNCIENHIRVLFLKGPVLAAELYGDVSLRTSIDLDVLISIDDLEEMEKLLVKSGYVKDDYIETVLSDWKWRHHHFTFFHPEKGIKLEVHWRLNPGPGKEPKFDELWERKRISSLTTSPLYFLGAEDLFLFLVSHGARHGWSRLRWLIDIDRIVRQNLDWSKLIMLLKKYHYLQIGGQALVLTSQLLKTPIKKEIEILIKGFRPFQLAQGAMFYFEKMVNLHTEPVPKDIASYHKRHLFSLMSIQQKLFFIVSFLYPYPADAETLPLPKFFHFLYFPLRPFLWAWRKTRNHALS
ncbi:Renal dipeptidase [Bacillus sp. AFS073361]|uniref:nucleotidyltransferase domain-containing protein n=1 Tax=Bacillus sp. AFS073361 TaxID=2033511 RepID=UPI000BF29D51|nr:nucleotidyltransferase family protein [Bacillus sp. AFS073361]PFP29484.1 Renal dipeptidase [Bacillus sp. AFS073361]